MQGNFKKNPKVSKQQMQKKQQSNTINSNEFIVNQYFHIPTCYKSKEEYCETFMNFYKNEVELEKKEIIEFSKQEFRFIEEEWKEISIRIEIFFEKSQNISDLSIFKLRIPYQDSNDVYEGYGITLKKSQKAHQKSKSSALVDINLICPFTSENQKLPQKTIKYASSLEVALLPNRIPLHKIAQTLKYFQLPCDKSQEIIRKTIFSCEPHKNSNFQLSYNQYDMDLTPNQKEIINSCLKNRLSLIQGPPGTGKTKVLLEIVTNWFLQNNGEKIIVCAPSNAAADLIAQKMYEVPFLQESFIRVYSNQHEDIFNMDAKNLSPYSLAYKMFYQDKLHNEFIKCLQLGIKFKYVKMQLEYYFGDLNYPKDKYMQEQADTNGYIDISIILNFKMMKYQWLATYDDIIEAANYTEIFELDDDLSKIRKKSRNINQKLKLFGLDKQAVRDLPRQKFEDFREQKNSLENHILQNTPIIICTNNSLNNKRFSDLQFKWVIMDEVSQASEIETLLPILDAKQVVLIGDSKQLGPIYKTQIQGAESLFTRLVEGKHPIFTLNTQFRMNPYISKCINEMFYDGIIQNNYKVPKVGCIFNPECPVIFINTDIQEKQYGASYYNSGEAKIVQELMEFFTQKNADLEDFGIIAPYNGQVQKIRELLTKQKIKAKVQSVESWQGSEKNFIIFSGVRNNDQKKIGFLSDLKRMNVALSRAKHGLIIIGSEQTFQQNKLWNNLIQKFQNDNIIVESVQQAKDLMYPHENIKNTSHSIQNSNNNQDFDDDFM